jgi:hypothetical protein
MWKQGAILKLDNGCGGCGGYVPITDLWDTTDQNEGEYISARIIENNPDWFERVYEMNPGKKAVYLIKEKAQQVASKFYEED